MNLNARRSQMGCTLLVLAVGATCPVNANGDGWRLPEALRRAEAAARESVSTAVVEYVYRRSEPGSSHEQLEYYSWRCAGENYVQVRRGDENGVVVQPGDGEQLSALALQERHVLVEGRQMWRRDGGSTAVDVAPLADAAMWRIADLRTIAADPGALFGSLGGLQARAAEARVEDVSFSQTQEGGLEVVTAELPLGKMRWWIDPERGWSIVRTASFHGEKQVLQTDVDLESINGVWFPKRVERKAFTDAGPEIVADIEVLFAEFNRPGHPTVLSPNDIGVEPGSLVRDLIRGSHSLWDGQKPVSPDEFFARVQSGELKKGPTVARNQHRLLARDARFGAAASGTRGGEPREVDSRRGGIVGEIELWLMTEWEEYTAKFILSHRLDSRQQSEAREVLQSAQQEARQYVARRRAEFEAFQQESDALGSSADGDADRRREKLLAKREKLVGPIHIIFETRLKRGLERIPSDAQRKAAAPSKPQSQL